MKLSDNCKNCKIGYAIKCESGEEYICCDSIQKCQEEKKEEHGDCKDYKDKFGRDET